MHIQKYLIIHEIDDYKISELYRGETDSLGGNLFDKFNVTNNGKERCLSEVQEIPIYHWIEGDCYNNFDDWIDKAVAKFRLDFLLTRYYK